MSIPQDAPTAPHVTLIDAHAHYHRQQNVVTFLDSAAHAFQAAADRLPGAPTHTGCLLMADVGEQSTLSDLTQASSEGALPGWIVDRTDESISIVCQQVGGLQLFLVAGRQVRCAEDLEVLLLGSSRRMPDGLPIRTVLKASMPTGEIVVLPWGVGKWSFRRGKVIRSLIASDEYPFYLGDNSGRPALLPSPPLFDIGRRYGRRVLAGSDPLPFAGESAGGFGFLVPGTLDSRHPMQSLMAWLSTGDQPQSYGQLESLGRFLNHQLAMQIRKRYSCNAR